MSETTNTGAERIADERQRQIDVEGYTARNDIESSGSNQGLALAAAAYALPIGFRGPLWENTAAVVGQEERPAAPRFWPWGAKWWKPTPHNRIRELEKAGALIAAEIDRLIAIGVRG